VDVGLAQIEGGLAGWCRKYAKRQSLQDRVYHARAGEAGKIARIGLWGDSQAAPPFGSKDTPAQAPRAPGGASVGPTLSHAQVCGPARRPRSARSGLLVMPFN
jgi:hypothetical protein